MKARGEKKNPAGAGFLHCRLNYELDSSALELLPATSFKAE
jgi:hypothetical protein